MLNDKEKCAVREVEKSYDEVIVDIFMKTNELVPMFQKIVELKGWAKAVQQVHVLDHRFRKEIESYFFKINPDMEPL